MRVQPHAGALPFKIEGRHTNASHRWRPSAAGVFELLERMVGVLQWGVQLVIGRLLTDEDFRRRVESGGSAYLTSLRKQRVDLNREEIAALIGTDPRVWSSMAKRIDLRLQNGRVASDYKGQNARHSFTERQRQVLEGVCDGLRNKDIAAQLGVSEGAVKATLQQLFHKVSVRRRAQLVRIALEESF